MTKPRVSLVLPAYNEAAHLRACLDAIFAQTVRPHEVIVVDNNSTDETAAIARSYAGVRVLSEKRQGVVFARNRGFDAARGDIIGRIDADTLLPVDWIGRVQEFFIHNDATAVTGAVHYYDVALSKAYDACDRFARTRLARALQPIDQMFLQGANMAIRRTSWLQVRERLCSTQDMHEDFDLAIHLQNLGLSVKFEKDLIANISARRTDVGFLAFANYVQMSPHTYAQHNSAAKRHVYEMTLLAWAAYLPGRLLYRGYDPRTERFSLKRAIALRSVSRPNPSSSSVR